MASSGGTNDEPIERGESLKNQYEWGDEFS